MYVRIRGGEVRTSSCGSTSRRASSRRFCAAARFIEAPDITARICGICPVAYQMSACPGDRGRARGRRSTSQIRALRRLIYCGEWIESHALHVFMLHAPDFLGYESALAMARDHREIVERGLRLKKAGNAADRDDRRARDPPDQRSRGGFYRAPSRARAGARSSTGSSGPARLALETVRWVGRARFPRPRARLRVRGAALSPDEYPIEDGRIVSGRGIDIGAGRVRRALRRRSRSRTPTLCIAACGTRGSYLGGPMARFTLNLDRLSPLAREAAERGGAGRGLPQPVPEHRRAGGGDPLRLRRGAAADRALRAARSAGGRGWSRGPAIGTG